MNVFCSQNTPAYTQVDCGVDQAGIVAVGFVDENVATPTKVNLESSGWYSNLLHTSPPTLFVAPKTRGEYPGGTPTEEDGFGKVAKQVVGAEHTMTFEFEGVEENRNFVEAINSKHWKMVAVTNSGKGLYIDAPCSIYGKLNVPRGINTAAFWMIECKWSDYANPVTFDAPSDIFAE